jgi:hypothetical protein
MAKLTPQELLSELEAFAQGPPAEVEKDPGLGVKISQAAKQVVLSLEKPSDVVARLFLSQVRSYSRIRTKLPLTSSSPLNNLQSALHLVSAYSVF